MKRRGGGPIGLALLGATGTIGRQTLEIAERFADRVRVLGLAAGRNGGLLAGQVNRHRPAAAALADEAGVADFRRAVDPDWSGRLLVGDEATEALARWPGADVVVNGVVGAAGLRASLAVLRAGRRLALANKESLVMAGHLLREAAEASGGELLPIDSEHGAILQCLAGLPHGHVRRIVLTASGGPFRTLPPERLATVTAAEALRHPTWRMGPRITVDSATLFNKGLEVIEARWLFDLSWDQIDVWIHPQSIVHGLVETIDGSLIAQLSLPDMRLPIQLALSYPERWEATIGRCDLAALGELTFEAPDADRFPCLGLVRRAARMGGAAPAVINAADEVLVAEFLAGRIGFAAIAAGLKAVLGGWRGAGDASLDGILAADRWARGEAARLVHAGQLCPGGGERG